jgi:uridine kinase
MRRNTRAAPLLVAIVGGSGAGKSCLADQLLAQLGAEAARLSLDDFYLDRSHLSLARRCRINFDHPRAVDWRRAEQVLQDCLNGRVAKVPCYDFKTHARLARVRLLPPKPVILLDGLWWLRRVALRPLFELSIFIDCPRALRLKRRLARDLAARGRDKASVHRQFWQTVEPMHRRFVLPQARWAHVRLNSPVEPAEVERLVRRLRTALDSANQHHSRKSKSR